MIINNTKFDKNMIKEELKEILFPHEKIRNIQDVMISEVYGAIKNKKNIIVHAPTGIGKTVSVLSPTLSYAMDKDLTIYFLTSRQTQHKIVIDTLKQIKKKYNNEFGVADIIGKKWMCLQEVESLYSNDFADYCKKLRDEDKCEFYLNTLKKSRRSTVLAENALNELKVLSPLHVNINPCQTSIAKNWSPFWTPRASSSRNPFRPLGRRDSLTNPGSDFPGEVRCASAVRNILVDIVSESARKMIWPDY